MNKDINLIRSKAQTPFAILIDKISLTRILSFGTLFIVSALSISFFLLVSFSPLPSIQQKEIQKTAVLQSLRTRTSTLLGVQDRLKNVQSFLPTRPNLDVFIQSLKKQSATDLTMDSLQIDHNIIDISVSTPSLESLNAFLSSLEKNNSDPLYSRITVSQLTTDVKANKYIVRLSLIL